MRMILISLFILIGNNHGLTQDLITKLDGTIIEVKIIELTENSIKYREYNDPNGILYTSDFSYLSHIKFVDFVPPQGVSANGALITKNKESNYGFIVNGKEGYSFDELKEFIKQDDIAYLHFEKYKRYKLEASILGVATIGIFVGSSIVILNSDNSGDSPPDQALFGLLAIVYGVPVLGTTALIFYVKSKKQKNRVISTYGITSPYLEKSFKSDSPQLRIGIVSSGLGVQINF